MFVRFLFFIALVQSRFLLVILQLHDIHKPEFSTEKVCFCTAELTNPYLVWFYSYQKFALVFPQNSQTSSQQCKLASCIVITQKEEKNNQVLIP